IFFFFFQAEDGIRDKLVTGVQTCALPIFWRSSSTWSSASIVSRQMYARSFDESASTSPFPKSPFDSCRREAASADAVLPKAAARSEERRVGKESRARW